MLVSMLTPEQSSDLGLSKEERVCDHHGIRFFNYRLRIALFLTKAQFEIS